MAQLVEPDGLTNELSRAVIGAAIEVHRHLGPGFLESVYEEALAVELTLRGLAFQRQHPVELRYKGHRLKHGRVDFVVGGRLVVELKAVEALIPIHKAQVLSYLRMLSMSLGLLLNFNVAVMTAGTQRIVLTA